MAIPKQPKYSVGNLVKFVPDKYGSIPHTGVKLGKMYLIIEAAASTECASGSSYRLKGAGHWTYDESWLDCPKEANVLAILKQVDECE